MRRKSNLSPKVFQLVTNDQMIYHVDGSIWKNPSGNFVFYKLNLNKKGHINRFVV